MDLVLLGGRVLTMNDAAPRAEALAIRDGKIVAVGDSAHIASMIQPATEVVPLNGRSIVPGFIDPHTHFSTSTFEPVAVDCRIPPMRGKTQVLDAIAAAAAAAPPGRWIWGYGYSARRGEHPSELTRRELDRAAPNNPVCIFDSSMHCCYVNTSGMASAGIERDAADPDGGEIRREDGDPTGTLWERAMNPAHEASMGGLIDAFGDQAIADLVHQTGMRYLACGITSAGDAAVTPAAARLYEIADRRGRLPILIHQLRSGEQFFAAPERAARGEVGGEYTSDRIRAGTVKIFMDPVFPRTAAVQFHADGREEQVGKPYYTQEQADDLAVTAARHGLQVAIHCLGTWAIEQGLNAIERANAASSSPDLRHRLEHFSTATRAQIARAAELGLLAVVQPSFLYASTPAALKLRVDMGLDTASLPMRTMLDAGVNVVASSDFPCGPLEPILGIHSIVSRHARDMGDPLAPEEAVTAEEAIRAYTISGARAMHREAEVGSLEVGKRADLVVLSNDPTAVEPFYIREIVVEQTYVDGKRLFDRYGRQMAGAAAGA